MPLNTGESMCTITYNAELRFKDKADQTYWSRLLDTARLAYNKCANILDSNKIHLDLKSVHNAVYYILREEFPMIPSQGVIKIYKECISAFRSINSNGHIEHKIPTKMSCSMRLDKRLYSKFNLDSISLCSEKSNHRAIAELVKFPRLVEFFKKYLTQDPLIFKRNGKFYLSIPFNVPEIPIQNENCIGVDLGERRFAITSDGIMFNDNEYNYRKRKLRYLKKYLQKKGTKSAIKHRKQLSVKERNQSTDMCYKMANALIKSTNASIIVLEDLCGIKKKTSKTKDGFKKKNHNRRIGQVPFYKFKQILSYKALLNGKRVETVSPIMTSQTDCTTGKKDGTRKNRRFYSSSGRVFDADWNAAVNIAHKSKHPFSFKIPIDGALRTWKAGRESTSQSYVSLPMETPVALQIHIH